MSTDTEHNKPLQGEGPMWGYKTRLAIMFALAESLGNGEEAALVVAGELVFQATKRAHLLHNMPGGSEAWHSEERRADLREAAHNARVMLDKANIAPGEMIRASFLLKEVASMVDALSTSLASHASDLLSTSMNKVFQEAQVPEGLIISSPDAILSAFSMAGEVRSENALDAIYSLMYGERKLG